jgi:hypothetical protein
MKNDSRSCPSAEVDVSNARFSKGIDLGIDFITEIDVWAQMESRASYQIKKLRQNRSMYVHETLSDLSPIYYGIRQALE